MIFASFPTRGIWNSLDLSRSQFFLILVVSMLVFTFVGGPFWHHLRESHFWRLMLSYLIILPGVLWALWSNGRLNWLRAVVASAVLSAIKLVLTAILLVAAGVAA